MEDSEAKDAGYSLCPRCYRAVPKLAKEQFCQNCGEAMLQNCYHCNAPINSPYARFCTQCGQSLTYRVQGIGNIEVTSKVNFQKRPTKGLQRIRGAAQK